VPTRVTALQEFSHGRIHTPRAVLTASFPGMGQKLAVSPRVPRGRLSASRYEPSSGVAPRSP